MIRVALVTYALRLGGVETFLHNLAAGLRSNGYEVSFVETESKGEWSELTQKLGYPVVTLPRRFLSTRKGHSRRVAATLARFDALVINDSPLAMAALSALPPSVVAMPVLHMALPTMLANASAANGQWQRLVTVAPGLLDSLTTKAGLAPEQVICIPNGVPVFPLRSTQAKDPINILYVGRLEQEQKNIFAIPAILKLAVANGVALTLEIVGDGPDAFEFKERLKDCGIPYVLHGPLGRSETIDRMQQADVLLMPSFFEGLPMALLEAMSCGATPVASRLVGSTDTVVQSGVNGELLEPTDIHGFAEAIVRLAHDRDRLAAMARNAQETIRLGFSVEVMVSAYVRLIHDCARLARESPPLRTGEIDRTLLGDFSDVPYGLVRPIRKFLRLTGIYPKATPS